MTTKAIFLAHDRTVKERVDAMRSKMNTLYTIAYRIRYLTEHAQKQKVDNPRRQLLLWTNCLDLEGKTSTTLS